MKPMTFATKTINGKAFKKSRELLQLVEIKDIILDLNEDKGNEIDQLITYEEGAVPLPASHILPPPQVGSTSEELWPCSLLYSL